MRSVNRKSFIIESDSVLFIEEKTNSDPNTNLLMFTERTLRIKSIVWSYFKVPDLLDITLTLETIEVVIEAAPAKTES